MKSKNIILTGKIEYLGLKRASKGQEFIEIKILQTIRTYRKQKKKRFIHIIKVFHKELIETCHTLLPGDLIKVTGDMVCKNLGKSKQQGQYLLLHELVPVHI